MVITLRIIGANHRLAPEVRVVVTLVTNLQTPRTLSRNSTTQIKVATHLPTGIAELDASGAQLSRLFAVVTHLCPDTIIVGLALQGSRIAEVHALVIVVATVDVALPDQTRIEPFAIAIGLALRLARGTPPIGIDFGQRALVTVEADPGNHVTFAIRPTTSGLNQFVVSAAEPPTVTVSIDFTCDTVAELNVSTLVILAVVVRTGAIIHTIDVTETLDRRETRLIELVHAGSGRQIEGVDGARIVIYTRHRLAVALLAFEAEPAIQPH
jgi:hypothetical protein